MLSPSELDHHPLPSGKPRWRDRWQPRFWTIPGALHLVLAVVAAWRECDAVFIALLVSLGLTQLAWGFSGVPLRALSMRYRLFQAAVMLPVAFVPALLAEDVRVYCAGQEATLTAYISEYDLPPDTVARVYDYGDGRTVVATAGDEGRSHQYTRAGTYTVRLTVVTESEPQTDTCQVTVGT